MTESISCAKIRLNRLLFRETPCTLRFPLLQTFAASRDHIRLSKPCYESRKKKGEKERRNESLASDFETRIAYAQYQTVTPSLMKFQESKLHTLLAFPVHRFKLTLYLVNTTSFYQAFDQGPVACIIYQVQ